VPERGLLSKPTGV